jgi:endoglucanase
MAAAEELLRKLVEAPAVSGFEENVRDVIFKQLKPYADEIRVDRIGNVIARKGKGSPKILLAAHMDEIGLIVKYIEKEGFIRFDTLGGWDERIIPTQKIKVYGTHGPVFGVIGSKPPHLMEKDEMKQPSKVKELFIDIGVKSDKEVEKLGISIGDFISFHGQLMKLSGKRYTCHGFDNRIGCFVMIETFKRIRNFKGTVYAVGTVQEELGLIGVRGPIFGSDPDMVLALDTTIAGDTPGISPHESSIKLSAGPVIGVKDAVMVSNPNVRRLLTDTAKKNKVKFQLEVMSGGANDASIAPMLREGVPSGSLLVPARYIHSPIEVIDMADVENAIKIATAMVSEAHKYLV